jgi:hypothetical protein
MMLIEAKYVNIIQLNPVTSETPFCGVWMTRNLPCKEKISYYSSNRGCEGSLLTSCTHGLDRALVGVSLFI